LEKENLTWSLTTGTLLFEPQAQMIQSLRDLDLSKTSMKTTRSIHLLTISVFLAIPALAADLTFFAYSDCHYGAGEPPKTSTPVVDWINSLPGTPFPESIGGVVGKPRAVIMSGDLIDHGAVASKYPEEWKNYIAEFGVNGEGRCQFPVFEGMGNHDWNPNMFVYDKVKERNEERKKLGFIDNISENGYHYSWDWEGIHFINLNIFPGNGWHGEADTYSFGAHDPMLSRAFLEKDLRENVGNQGMPVVLIHHFRPIDENWWTFSAADKYHRIIQDYNVIMIMVGHQGGGVGNTWRGINWASSNGELDVFRVTPDHVLTAIARRETRWERPLQKTIFFDYQSSGLPAVINNGIWATDVTRGNATLNGKILYDATLKSEVTIHWGTNDGGDDPSAWDYAEKVGVQSAGAPFHTTISGLHPWTQYYYRCHLSNSKGEAWAAASIPFVTRGVLPEKWETAFIGYEQRPWGGAHLENGIFTVRGSGRDIGERGQGIDNFQYAFTGSTKTTVLSARLVGMEGKTRQPLAGIMMRETPAANSRSVTLLYSEREGLRLFSRSEPGGESTISKPVRLNLPVRLKLEREGDLFAAYASTDGKDWTPVGEAVTNKMADAIKAGLAVTAGNRDGSRHQDAKFDELYLR
jgi:hypothetical protein